MGNVKRKNLLSIGFEPGEALKAALIALQQPEYSALSREEKLQLMQAVLQNPGDHLDHPVLGITAQALSSNREDDVIYPGLRSDPAPYRIFGAEGIEEGAHKQMQMAASLPVSVAGALMPDAHQGYGLPIGGVLATEGVVIPYAVGVDIGCRMCMTVYPLPESHLKRYGDAMGRMLMEETAFGAGQGMPKVAEHPVLERSEFQEIAIVRQLKDKAWRQIGSSGSGNHFVEWGIVELLSPENEWQVAPGRYLALLSHSGSRGLGAGIADHFTRIAMAQCRLPKEAKHLAWLSLHSEAGQSYWQAMTLAGDYASACHHQIHERLARALGEKPAFMVENHHNFAWRETLPDGKAVIVHRKGATPAGAGVLGIIPGSMTLPGYIVRGKGNALGLNSAAHGAGRMMSRGQALKSISRSQMDKALREQGVTLFGGSVDESPAVYKDIRRVMELQRELVDVLGLFYPKIVRMDA